MRNHPLDGIARQKLTIRDVRVLPLSFLKFIAQSFPRHLAIDLLRARNLTFHTDPGWTMRQINTAGNLIHILPTRAG